MLYQKCFISISFCTTCCADLLFTYKLVFGLLDVNVSEFFITQFSNKRRGHRYKLYVLTCKSSVRYNCFSHRVIRVWNILPHCVNFTTYNDFKHSLIISVLIKFCKLFFYVMRIVVVLITVYCIPLLQCMWPYGPFVK